MGARVKGRLVLPESPDEGLVIVPFGFDVNGTSNGDGLIGDQLVSAVFAEAGEYVLTFKDKPAVCFFGDAGISNTTDDVDLYAKVDWSTMVSAGTCTIRCMTGATQTTPTDNLKIGGFLLVKKTTRRAR